MTDFFVFFLQRFARDAQRRRTLSVARRVR